MPVKLFVPMITVLWLALLLGCSSHSNPLKTSPPKVAAKFLVEASRAAEKQLAVFNAPGGYYYGVCLQGKLRKVWCNQLYRAMVKYAHTTSAFQTVTVRDLTDSTLFEKLKPIYQHTQFNAV